MMTDACATNPRPRRKFITDLIKDIKQKQEDPHRQIVLGIDANKIIESPGIKVKTTSITQLVRECGLVDVYAHQHEILGDTSRKKRHKIDQLLISLDLLPSVI